MSLERLDEHVLEDVLVRLVQDDSCNSLVTREVLPSRDYFGSIFSLVECADADVPTLSKSTWLPCFTIMPIIKEVLVVFRVVGPVVLVVVEDEVLSVRLLRRRDGASGAWLRVAALQAARQSAVSPACSST